jgi:hypothetical protein
MTLLLQLDMLAVLAPLLLYGCITASSSVFSYCCACSTCWPWIKSTVRLCSSICRGWKTSLWTFASVAPFSSLFFINALLSSLKSLLQDSNLLTGCLARCMPVSLRAEGSTAAFSPRQQQLSSLSTALQRLFACYLQSPDLTLNRHQVFLSESCAKCVIVVKLLFHYLSRPPHDSQLLLLAAGFAFLWLVQLLTHAAVLFLLTFRQPSCVAVTVAPLAAATSEASRSLLREKRIVSCVARCLAAAASRAPAMGPRSRSAKP